MMNLRETVDGPGPIKDPPIYSAFAIIFRVVDRGDESIIRPFLGMPAIRGTRLTVFHLMDYFLAGETVEWVADFFQIPVGDARAAG
jgi:hypothetical protein